MSTFDELLRCLDLVLRKRFLSVFLNQLIKILAKVLSKHIFIALATS